ncbi:phosphate ABC transporter permease subunit PstC [Halorhabdus salina]|uniref:phosphate ABC transporter permease subunit PstC n=1 Tax=Halorhabdus salina TaxID=2750670 RepID=UPI002868328D|nr:phosphate ABC transporter permease subunit PstC [Halorhabdus salina]
MGARRVFVGTDPTPGEALVGLSSFVTIVGVGYTFLGPNELVVYPLVGFMLTVTVGWWTHQARVAKILTAVATVGTVLTVGFITYFLFQSAWPAVEAHGLALAALPQAPNGAVRWFFWLDAVLPVTGGETAWDPRSGVVSLLPAIWATVLVTIIAGLVAAPLGLAGALFIAEIASESVREIVKPAVEILAGIPSIVYGFIGFQVLNGFVQDAFLDAGASFFIAGAVVGLMALPTVVSVSEDALSSVPDSMSDGAIAMGATEWQTMKSISIPAAFSGISAAVILGLGRAIGETMAVAAIMSAGTGFARPLYDVFDQGVTLTSRIATSYGSASAGTIDVLFVAGVMLFVIVAAISVLAQYIERRMERKLTGER